MIAFPRRHTSEPRARSLSARHLSPAERAAGQLVCLPDDETRPRTRADCVNGPRPCPWVSCKHHLFADVNATGSLKLNFPSREPGEIPTTCALDVADQGWNTLDAVAQTMNLTRERVRQLEEIALAKIERRDPEVAQWLRDVRERQSHARMLEIGAYAREKKEDSDG